MTTQTTIRVKFPDQTQLEKKFPSTDKIRSIYAFVRGCLRDDVKPIKFILCSSFSSSLLPLLLNVEVNIQTNPLLNAISEYQT
jgi:hypothetical protein